MTDQTTTEDTSQDTPASPQDTAEDVSAATEASVKDNPNREAARYRKALRDAEAERDQLKAQRDELARSIAEQHLPGGLPVRLFWEQHQDVTSLFDDQGRIDADKVKEAGRQLITDYGLSTSPIVPVVPDAGKQPDRNANTGWTEVVRGRPLSDEL